MHVVYDIVVWNKERWMGKAARKKSIYECMLFTVSTFYISIYSEAPSTEISGRIAFQSPLVRFVCKENVH